MDTPTSDPLVAQLRAELPGVPDEILRAFAGSLISKFDPQRAHDAFSALMLPGTGVLSLSASPTEPTMWSHYSRNHEGFCVGLSSGGLLADCKAAGREVDLFAVDYVDERPDFAFEDLPALELLRLHLKTKSRGWAYEQEYRLVEYFVRGDRMLRISPDTVVEVLIGCRMPAGHRSELIEELRAIPDVLLRQVKRERQSLKLKVVSLGLSQNQHRGPEFDCTPRFSIGADVHCTIVCPSCAWPDRVIIARQEFAGLPTVRCGQCGQQGHVFILFG